MPKIRGLPQGVYPQAKGQGWISHIYIAGKSQYIGSFKTYTEARKAWESVYLEWYGQEPPEWDPEDVLRVGEQRNACPKVTNISIRLPHSLVADLKTLAKDTGVPYSTYVRNVLAEHINK